MSLLIRGGVLVPGTGGLVPERGAVPALIAPFLYTLLCTVYVEPVPNSMLRYTKHYQILSDNLWDNVYQGSHRDCKT